MTTKEFHNRQQDILEDLEVGRISVAEAALLLQELEEDYNSDAGQE